MELLTPRLDPAQVGEASTTPVISLELRELSRELREKLSGQHRQGPTGGKAPSHASGASASGSQSASAQNAAGSPAVSLDSSPLGLRALPAAAVPDCSICCSRMTDPAIGGGCAHHFCEDCLIQWIDQGKTSCPTCRAPVTTIIRDLEFASLTGCPTSPAANRKAPRNKAVAGTHTPETRQEVRVRPPCGLTLANSPYGTGVVVTKVTKGSGGARAHIRVGDIVSAINGTATSDHTAAAQTLERAGRHGGATLDLICTSADHSTPRRSRELPGESVPF